MPDPRTTSAVDARMPSGTEIYDRIMSSIDMDLISTSLPDLEARYATAGETVEQKEMRHARYEESFAAYDKKYAEFLVNLHKEVTHEKSEARKAAEMEDHDEDQKKEVELLSQMSNA